MLLLLLSCFSRVQLCVTPQTAAPQAPPSLGFSRQEYWSGLPFPSPCSVTKSCQILATPCIIACQAPLLMEFTRQEYWSGLPFLSPGDLPDPGTEPWSPAWQAGSLPSESLEKSHTYVIKLFNTIYIYKHSQISKCKTGAILNMFPRFLMLLLS